MGRATIGLLILCWQSSAMLIPAFFGEGVAMAMRAVVVAVRILLATGIICALLAAWPVGA